MVKIREALESDAQAISQIFRKIYGADYCYPEFYEPSSVRKMIFADDTIMLVAEDDQGRVVGTASVLEEKGAMSDLLGEFGRLAVHPDARGANVGNQLMQGRIEHVQERLHVGVVETRLVHPFAQKISASHGFAAVGYLPSRLVMDRRENVGFFVRHFGPALRLRRNHPRIIPEVYPFAVMALENCGLPMDIIVDESSPSYPHASDFAVHEMTTSEGYASLLRIERGRLQNREVFGPVGLHYGYFKLKAKNSHYLLAKEDGRLAGAIGFTVDDVEKNLHIFELIGPSDATIRFLLETLLKQVQALGESKHVAVDVSAYAPRMQRTLLELGFLPVAYVPAMVFHHVERLDIVKMVRLLTRLDTSQDTYIPALAPIARRVSQQFIQRDISPRLLSYINELPFFDGLTDEQRRSVVSACDLQCFGASETIFEKDTESDSIYIVLDGKAEFGDPDSGAVLGQIGPGECLGEVSVILGADHSVTVHAISDVEAARLPRDELDALIRMRPDIGLVLYRNMARELSHKLKRTDLVLLELEL